MSCGSMTAQAFDQRRCVSTMCVDEDDGEIAKKGGHTCNSPKRGYLHQLLDVECIV